MSATTFKVGDSVTACGGMNESPRAVLTVAKVGARVTLSDGSVWFVPRHAMSSKWRLFGEHRAHDRYAFIRSTEPGDGEIVRKKNAEAARVAEHRRLVGRIVGLGWGEVEALPLESLRIIAAHLDAGKGGR